MAIMVLARGSGGLAARLPIVLAGCCSLLAPAWVRIRREETGLLFW